MHEMNLYERMIREEARQRGAKKFVPTRWVDVQKEDGIRSRLVAKKSHAARGWTSSAQPRSLKLFAYCLLCWLQGRANGRMGTRCS